VDLDVASFQHLIAGVVAVAQPNPYNSFSRRPHDPGKTCARAGGCCRSGVMRSTRANGGPAASRASTSPEE